MIRGGTAFMNMNEIILSAESAEIAADESRVWMLLKGIDAYQKVVGQQAIVCIEEGDEFSLCFGQSTISGGRKPAISLAQVPN